MSEKFVPLHKRKYRPLGSISAAIIAKADRYAAENYESYPFVVESAHGPWLIDPDGNMALDFLAGYSSILSHCLPDVCLAVERELIRGADLTSRAVYSVRFAEFVELVCQLTGYDRVHPKSDGGSATDSAISGLLMHGHARGIKNPEVILTEDYFHGRTWIFGSNALFDSDQSFRRNPRAPGVVVVPNTVEAVTGAVNKNTIGIFIENHKGEGGPLFSTREHYMALRSFAYDNTLFFGVDEIQTGLGRCGYMMSWQEYGEEARPDFITLGKALGGGIIPVSAVVGNELFMSVFTPGSDGSTFGGYPLACAAACASLQYIVDNDIPAKAKEIGAHFVSKLKGVHPRIGVENRGALIRVELHGVKTAKYACLEMLVGKKRSPRVFMKAGHYDAKRDVAYTRIAPPIAAMTKDLIDLAVENTIIPVLKDALR